MKNSKEGITLVEVLVAIGVTSLAVIALVKAVSLSVKSSNFSKMQSAATDLAQKLINETIEKSQQPSLYPNFFIYEDTGLYTLSEDGNFCYRIKREIKTSELLTTTPDYVNAKMVKITVYVYWEGIGSGSMCGKSSYARSRTFETYVTN